MPAPSVRALLLVLLLTAAGCAAAQGAAKEEAAAGPNDGCLMCHADPSAKSAAGKAIAVDAKKFAASVHGAMSLPCTTCHADVQEGVFPHGEVKPAQCASCHEQAVKDYAGTAHGKARSGGRDVAASCADCHGAHDIAKRDDPASRVHRANLESTCASCHGNEALIQRANLPGGNVASRYHDSIHGQAIANKTSAQGAAPTCTSCHGAHDLRGKDDPASKVARANIPSTCATCHMNAKAEWEKSQHGRIAQSAAGAAPGCIDCHTAHDIAQHTDPKFKLAVTDRCGTCHADFADTYRDTFHGQVTQLGYAQIATCASCHGAHQVLPKENPLSRVSDQNRLATCQACHPKANANFVSYDPHANRHVREQGQLLFFTGKFMDFLLLGVFSVFGLHTVLWFVRSLRAMRERRGTPRH